MRRFCFHTIAGLSCVLLAAACSAEQGGDSQTGAARATGQVQAADLAVPGVLSGRILFQGTLPPPRRIQVNKDVNECHHAEGEVQDVVVSEDKGLAGVVLEIQGIKDRGDRSWQQPDQGYVIRQKGCWFQPHLLVVPIAAELSIYNDDPVTHNINTGQWNEAQGPDTGVPLNRKIRGRGFVRVNCNIHSWMESWIYVAQSPYYAVTGPEGRFRIEELPPGSYTVTASHPTLGTERFQIAVGAGQTVEHEVMFRAS